MRQRIAQWFGFYVLDMERVAQALAADILREYEAVPLEEAGTVRMLKSRYLRLVAACGLPPAACEDVARRAWRLVARSAEVAASSGGGFSFYE